MTTHDLHLLISSLGQAIACVGLGLAIAGAVWWWEERGKDNTNHVD